MYLQIQAIDLLQALSIIVDDAIQICILKLHLPELFLDSYLALPQLLDLRFLILVLQHALLEFVLALQYLILGVIVLSLKGV